MIKTCGVLGFAIALLFLPVTASAQVCFGSFCDWLDEDFYDSSDWYKSGVTFPQINDPCLWGAPLNHVAKLPASSWMESHPFFIDGNSYSATRFKLEFNLYLPGDTQNWYDRLKVMVIDHTAGTTETFFISGDEYDTACSRYNIQLSRNYLNHSVSVYFNMSWLASSHYEIDNVSFVQY